MILNDVYLLPVLNSVPRLLGLLNRNISSSSYGSFDREYWHYNTVDFSCARKQEAVLTLTLLYLIKHEKNRYYRNEEILNYIRAALMFWTKIQNKNGSFNEWYPHEHSFVVTAFSTYAVSESLLLIKNELSSNEYQRIMGALKKAGDWLISRNETRVMNQQTGAATALINLYLLTDNTVYRDSSREKIKLLKERQSNEGWFVEYGGPDIGYLSLAIDYLSKYFSKTMDREVKEIITRALGFIKYFIQPNLIAGGEYASRNTEYLVPDGFEIFSQFNDDAQFIASAIRKSLLKTDSFPNLFDDRYLTYIGYTWLQAYMDANPGINESADSNIDGHFSVFFKKYFEESGLLIINDEHKYMVVNMKKGGSFRLFDKKSERTYSDSGILVSSAGRWYTSGWLANVQEDLDGDSLTISGKLLKVPDKNLDPLRNIMLRLFQITFGRSGFISLWIKERLRDILISKTKLSNIRYNRTMIYKENSSDLLKIIDSVFAEKNTITSISVYAKDTHIYVPSSRYYVDMKETPIQENFTSPVENAAIEWTIRRDSGIEFTIKK